MRQAPYLARQAGTIHRDRIAPARAQSRDDAMTPHDGDRSYALPWGAPPALQPSTASQPAAPPTSGGQPLPRARRGRREVDEEPSHPNPATNPVWIPIAAKSARCAAALSATGRPRSTRPASCGSTAPAARGCEDAERLRDSPTRDGRGPSRRVCGTAWRPA